MPRVQSLGLTINYEEQGEGEPLLLIPYLAADHACYAFQLPAYTEHFRCISVDLPGSGTNCTGSFRSSSVARARSRSGTMDTWHHAAAAVRSTRATTRPSAGT